MHVRFSGRGFRLRDSLLYECYVIHAARVMSNVFPKYFVDMAVHSMCQPGNPFPTACPIPCQD